MTSLARSDRGRYDLVRRRLPQRLALGDQLRQLDELLLDLRAVAGILRGG